LIENRIAKSARPLVERPEVSAGSKRRRHCGDSGQRSFISSAFLAAYSSSLSTPAL
jgi:hypothetical protein